MTEHGQPGDATVQPSEKSIEPTRSAAPSSTDRIGIEEFSRIDLRVARIVEAEPIPGATRLLKLTVDLGAENRQLVAGIAQAYRPDELVGRSIVVVTNLEPARLRGVDSDGMLLAANPEGGQPVLVTFLTEVAPGTVVR